MTMTSSLSRGRTLLLGLALALALPFAACEDEDSPASKSTQASKASPTAAATRNTPDEVEEDVEAALKAQSDGNTEEFLKYWTPQGLQAEFRSTPDEVRQAGAESFQQPLEARAFRGTQVSGNTATTEVDIENEGAIFGRSLTMTFEGGNWRVTNSVPSLVAAPSGATRVNVQMTEFQFIFEPSAFRAGAPVYIEGRNVGGQDHELVFFKLDENVNLQEALQSEDEPEGIEFKGFLNAAPGRAASFATLSNLDSGRYAMVCFIPDVADPAETPHALKGMLADFRIQ
jgi:hypothetical protein